MSDKQLTVAELMARVGNAEAARAAAGAWMRVESPSRN